MRVDLEARPTDVLPRAGEVRLNAKGETVTFMERVVLDGSRQNWGAQLLAGIDLYERMTTMVVTRCDDEQGRLAGVLWLHPRVDSDGHEEHEVYLPVVEATDETKYSAMDGQHWPATSADPLTLVGMIECPCGQKGFIDNGAWCAEERT